jgi:hypothetical protein
MYFNNSARFLFTFHKTNDAVCQNNCRTSEFNSLQLQHELSRLKEFLNHVTTKGITDKVIVQF